MIQNYESSTHLNSIRKQEESFILKKINFYKGLNKISIIFSFIILPLPLFFSLLNFCFDFNSCSGYSKYSFPLLIFIFIFFTFIFFSTIKRYKKIKSLNTDLKNLYYCKSIVQKKLIN